MTQKQQPTKITAIELQRLSGQIIRRAYHGEHFIVERDGLPVIVILSATDYEELQRKTNTIFK